jgi:C-5 cytosine-specific DNA methylase
MTFVAAPLDGTPYADREAEESRLVVAAPLSHGSNPNSNAAGRRREDDVNLVAETVRSHPRPGSNSLGNLAVTLALDVGMGTVSKDRVATLRSSAGNGDIPVVTHALSSVGADASEDGTGRGTPLVVTGGNDGELDDRALASAEGVPCGAMHEVRQDEGRGASQGRRLAQQRAGEPREAVSELPLQDTQPGEALRREQMSAAEASARLLRETRSAVRAMGRPSQSQGQSALSVGVRRLTPLECERLQALPDGWTMPGADSKRYAGLGDAVTASVAEWIGKRILARSAG